MSARYCLECGAPLPDLETGGLCSICALRGALEGGVASGMSATGRQEKELGADSMPWAKGQKFGDYEILEEVAHGGMGIVYRARQISLDRIVAIKMLLPGLSSPEYLRRFRIEASTAAGLQHANIVAIHEVGVWQGRQYLVMDFVAGRSLAQRIAEMKGGARDFKKIARWVAAIADAIQYAHDRGILHRDLKPSNVLIDEEDHPRVSDFGLAKRVGEESEITLSGHALGSPSFMPPEQAGSHDKVSRRSDVYGLGGTLYYALTGSAPFKGGNPAEVMHEVLTSDPVPPRSLDSAIPRDLETICLKCLEKEPARRYATARMVAEELGRFLDNKPILERPVNVPEKIWRWCRRKPLVAGLAAVLVVSLALGGWLGWQSRQSSQQLEQERMRAAIDRALEAAWSGDRAAAEEAIEEAERHGAANEWLPMLRGQIALYSPQTDEAVKQFELAVGLAPKSVAAKAMQATAYLYNGQFDRWADILESLGALSPKTPEDYLFLGATLVGGYPDTSRAVALLEHAAQKHPSGITFIQLAMAEGFHAADAGSWPIAEKAIKHCDAAAIVLGEENFVNLCVRLNTCNFAMRLCPEKEKAGLRARAAEAARALESTMNPVGQMQRAFYFQITGDEAAELQAWRKTVRKGVGGMYVSFYAAAMLNRNRSGEALEVLNLQGPASDGLEAIARAFLLLDSKHPEGAEKQYSLAAASVRLKVLAETIFLLAGDSRRTAAEAARLLDRIPPQHPDYQALQFYAGRISAEELAAEAGSSRYLACGDYYLAAMFYLARGEREAARQYFRRSVETGTHWLTQYQWSRAFLGRMERDPHWPPWIGAKRNPRPPSSSQRRPAKA
jgi:tetratricopeptide (TPR) repeat protein